MKFRLVQKADRSRGNPGRIRATEVPGRAREESVRAVRFDRVRVGREGVRDGSYDHPDVLSLMIHRLRQHLVGNQDRW